MVVEAQARVSVLTNSELPAANSANDANCSDANGCIFATILDSVNCKSYAGLTEGRRTRRTASHLRVRRFPRFPRFSPLSPHSSSLLLSLLLLLLLLLVGLRDDLSESRRNNVGR
jgi:predicted lysophospholipase L1 biosynthesis ABC-type transport system permease subunit